MARSRDQRGRVELTGKKVKKWKGYYYVYVRQDDQEKRRHHSVTLGLKSEISKAQARRQLQEIIDRETGNPHAKPNGSVTFKWFWSNRYKPVKGKALKASSRYHLVWLVEKHLIPWFGEKPLSDITRFELQCYLQGLADRGYSYSMIHKART